MTLTITCDADKCKSSSDEARIQQWSALFLPKGWKFIYGGDKVAKIFCPIHGKDIK